MPPPAGTLGAEYQQIMSVMLSGPFNIGRTDSPTTTSSHQRAAVPRNSSDSMAWAIYSSCAAE